SLVEQRFGSLRPKHEAVEPSGPRTELGSAPPSRPAQQSWLAAEKWLLTDAATQHAPGGFGFFTLELPGRRVRFEHDYREGLVDDYLCVLIQARLALQHDRFGPRGSSCKIARPAPDLAQLRLQAWAKPQQLRAAVEALVEELARIVQHGFELAEVQRPQPRFVREVA